MNCTEPPERPGSGTWEWNGDLKFGTDIVYTCGPFGNFMNETGHKYPLTLATCSWGQTWDPPQLDPCVATSCQVNCDFCQAPKPFPTPVNLCKEEKKGS